jgi:hypothetical protein
VEFATAAFTYEAEADAWERAYWELDDKFKRSLSSADLRLTDISAKHNAAGEAWKRELAKAKRREHMPGLGIFIGAGHTGSGVEPVIGIGLTWKVF